MKKHIPESIPFVNETETNQCGIEFIIEILFEELDPFIKGVLYEERKYNLSERLKYQQMIEYLDINFIGNIYDVMYDKFYERICDFFEKLMKKFKRMPKNEECIKKIREEITKYEYGRKMLISLFTSTDAYFIGADYSITGFLKNNWERLYFEFVKQTYHVDLMKQN